MNAHINLSMKTCDKCQHDEDYALSYCKCDCHPVFKRGDMD